MKTNELTGAALDWAVAKCEGLLAYGYEDDMGLLRITLSTGETEYFIPTMKWEQGGLIIERERILVQPEVGKEGCANAWSAISMKDTEAYGPTPLIAAMRCFIASHLGDDVQVPEELR